MRIIVILIIYKRTVPVFAVPAIQTRYALSHVVCYYGTIIYYHRRLRTSS